MKRHERKPRIDQWRLLQKMSLLLYCPKTAKYKCTGWLGEFHISLSLFHTLSLSHTHTDTHSLSHIYRVSLLLPFNSLSFPPFFLWAIFLGRKLYFGMREMKRKSILGREIMCVVCVCVCVC